MELIENKDLFQIVFNSASNGIAVIESVYNNEGKIEDFSILLFNTHTLDLISDTKYKGKLYSEIFPHSKEIGILDKFIEVAETGLTACFEQWYEGDGLKRWFRFTAIKQDNLLIVTTDDITESKQAEIALQTALDSAEKQKRVYDSIINNTPDLVYVFDPQYKFTYANKALLTMWGKSADDAIGRGLRENGYEEWHAQMHEREIDELSVTKKAIRGTVSFPHAELGKRVYDYILVPVINERGEVEAIAGTTRDITEIKQAEEKVQQSETRFRNMIEQAPVAMLLSKGEDVIIESINKPMLKFMGKKYFDEVLGKKMIEALPELLHQQALQTVIDVQKSGIPFRGDECPVDLVINNKLEHRYFNFSYDLIEESEDSSAVLHMALDVTQQVLDRKKLQDSESRLKSMINQTPCPTLVLKGDDLIIEQINKHMLSMIGRGEEIIGMPLIEVLPELKGQYVWTQVQNVYNKGIPFDQSEVLVQHNRTGVLWDYYYNLSYRPLIENEQITGMIQVAIDVTQQVVARKKMEESESRFRMLSDEMPQFVWTGDAQGNLGYYNQAMYKYSGLLLEDFIEMGWIKLLHPEDLEESLRLWKYSIDTGEDFIFEHRFRRSDGIYRWQLSRAVPQRDLEGEIQQWIGTSTDIQDKKIIEERLEDLIDERTKELQRSNEDLQQFAHVASHDLKEPVRKIKTFTSRLEHHLEGQLDDTSTRFIDRIHVATDRMFNMIDGVLAYSKINSDLQKSTLINLNEIVKNIETDLEVSLQKTAGKIQYDDLPTLEGAAVLIYQLFYNLINNSIKFAKENVAPQIILSSKIIEEHNRSFAVITVKDNGIGFEPEQASRIFETFTRLNSKDKYEGTGLGLSLCKKIVERHGGKIIAIGSINEGATFIITLPIEQQENDI
ncbi:PAS domain S-box protein [Pseudomonas shirazensis]